MAATMTASTIVAPVARPQAVAFKPATKAAKPVFVSNGTVAKTSAMLVWTPDNNKYFETFSFLPPLTPEQISKQVDYIVSNSFTPCLEFAAADKAYVSNENCTRFGAVSSGYQDNRYWTMWKLPMFGCQDGGQVLKEVAACTKAFPNAYVRLVAFDANRQVQIGGFLVHRPAGASDFQAPDKRSV